MIYELMHKDTSICLIELKKGSLGEEVKLLDFEPTCLVPYGIRDNPFNPESISESQILWWLRNRALPLNRAYARDILRASGISHISLGAIINISSLASLHDNYWLREYKENKSWNKTNLYRNPIHDTIAKVAFGNGATYTVSGKQTSPEYTTNGSLAKCWLVTKRRSFVLRKANGHYNEAYNEYYCSQILHQMGLKHVEYTLSKHKGQIVILCDNFNTEDIGFVPFSHFWKYSLDFESILSYISSTFNHSIVSDFKKMILFDCVVCNEDRHSNNFGFLINNNTNEVISLAPIFDNGVSLIDSCDMSYSAFKVTQHQLLRYLLDTDESLLGILKNIADITQHPSHRLPADEFKRKQSIIKESIFKAIYDTF